ncbi:hypothetical protein G1C98_1154 [Bifidobacterium sp. DSM 109960]|uniref:Organic solvents resistance ABC transporter permease n=1 Tax=Bifidobacterium erythrocebi TaxID=2675325 RepID=A0A7Y0EUV8_9BIFI|nr:DUF5719 family protein [Bifidobacterium sp. DSM 109960]NMM96418.1 hypothetical protein [Bifidobacterium sp. DSM 109960]
MTSNSTAARVMRIIAATVTSLVLVGALAFLGVVDMPDWLVDPAAGTSATSHRVVQERLESYCGERMQLPDSTDWGDSDYRASDGNIASSASFAAFGTVHAASVTPFDVDGAKTANLSGPASTGSDNGMTLRDDNAYPRLFDANLLKADAESGQAGILASRATEGDLRGISAATCVVPALSQSFLLPGTGTGSSQQLVLANPSSKPTTVSVEVYGTKAAGKMSLATSSNVTVRGNGRSTMDLSAAASGQDALYVKVASESTAVAASVRVIVMDGLTPKGSDFAMPLGEADTSNLIPSVRKGDKTTLYLYSEKNTTVRASWVSDNGLIALGSYNIKGQQVSAIDLGNAPSGANGIQLDSDDQFQAEAKATLGGSSGQEDFALLPSVAPEQRSAIALPDGYDTSLTLANTSNADTTATVAFMDADGSMKQGQQVTIKANSATTMNTDGVAAVVECKDGTVSWGLRLGSGDLSGKKIAGVSTVAPTKLGVRVARITSTNDLTLVR